MEEWEYLVNIWHHSSSVSQSVLFSYIVVDQLLVANERNQNEFISV